MKKRLRVYVIISLLVLSVFGLIGCSSSGGEKETPKEEATAEKPASNSKYEVTIDEAIQTTDSISGEPVLLVKFTFTNNSSIGMNFGVAIKDSAFQDNVQLNTTIFVSDSTYDAASTSTIADPGRATKVTVAYKLIDSASPVDVECSENSLTNKDVLASKTFNLA